MAGSLSDSIADMGTGALGAFSEARQAIRSQFTEPSRLESEFARLIGQGADAVRGKASYAVDYLIKRAGIFEVDAFLDTVRKLAKVHRGIQPGSAQAELVEILRQFLKRSCERYDLGSREDALAKARELLRQADSMAGSVYQKAQANSVFRTLLSLRDTVNSIVARRGKETAAITAVTTSSFALAKAIGGVDTAVILGEGGLAGIGIAGAFILAGAAVGGGAGCLVNMGMGEPCLGSWTQDAFERETVAEAMKEFGDGQSIPNRDGTWYGPLRPDPRNVAEK